LICLPVGGRRSLERLKIYRLVEEANPYRYIAKVLTAHELFQAHPELYDPAHPE